MASIKMRNQLRSQGIWNYVVEGYYKPSYLAVEMALTIVKKEKIEENRKKYANALSLIQQGVQPVLFAKTSTAQTSKESSETLQTSYQGMTKVKTIKLQNSRWDFQGLKMKEFDTVEQFIGVVNNIVNKLRLLGEDLSDQKVVEKVLRSMTKIVESVVAVIEEAKDHIQMSIEELLG